MIRAAIIGCGKMADQHALQIRSIPETEIVAVCDSESLMANQIADRFRISQAFGSAEEMLAVAKPDVVHITTPPVTHFNLARLCLETGCNVYVEKPFTLNATEAADLLALANDRRVKVTVGHNAQFTPAMVRMRDLVKSGYLGGKPVHMESHYSYSFGEPSYAKALLNDSNHWIRTLPGSLLQNIISHGISKIAEFLSGDSPSVHAYGFTSAFLKSIGEDHIVDEVRVLIRDRDFTTAFFTFSSQINPVPHEFRLYGPKNSLFVDDEHQIVIKVTNSEYKSYLRYFIPPLEYARQYVSNFRVNLGQFVRREFQLPNDFGLRTLIQAFYDSVTRNEPLPIAYREILLTSRIMDDIFSQIRQPD